MDFYFNFIYLQKVFTTFEYSIGLESIYMKKNVGTLFMTHSKIIFIHCETTITFETVGHILYLLMIS